MSYFYLNWGIAWGINWGINWGNLLLVVIEKMLLNYFDIIFFNIIEKRIYLWQICYTLYVIILSVRKLLNYLKNKL